MKAAGGQHTHSSKFYSCSWRNDRVNNDDEDDRYTSAAATSPFSPPERPIDELSLISAFNASNRSKSKEEVTEEFLNLPL